LGKDLNVGGWSEEEEEEEEEAVDEQQVIAELPSTLYFGVRGEQVIHFLPHSFIDASPSPAQNEYLLAH
jgi:hypothetical protein